MRYLVITTCNVEQWTAYGRAMVRTFCRHWPLSVPLIVYAEGFVGEQSKQVTFTDLDKAVPWLAPWKAERTPEQCGMVGGKYTYRSDARKFVHKVAAIGVAAERDDADILIWIDADIVTHESVTTEWLDSLFCEPASIAWLDREVKYPECGFLMFRLPIARTITRFMVEMYRSGRVFQYPETHDSYVLQQVVEMLEVEGSITVASLSGEGRKIKNHPFANSPLSTRMDHLKGGRKQMGHTPKSERRLKDDIPYWR